MFASAREWARFGQIHLDDGVAGRQRILPPGWVAHAATLTLATGYGAGFCVVTDPNLATHWDVAPAFHDEARRTRQAADLAKLAQSNETTWMGQQILPWMRASTRESAGRGQGTRVHLPGHAGVRRVVMAWLHRFALREAISSAYS